MDNENSDHSHNLTMRGIADRAGEPALEEHDANTDFSWNPIIYLYCLYIGIIVIGDRIGLQGASSAGAAVFLVCLYGFYWRSLFKLKLNLMLSGIALCMVVPLIPVASFDKSIMAKAYQELIKYYALNFVILLGLTLPLTPLPQARRAKLLYFVVLIFLLSGWLFTPVEVVKTYSEVYKPVMGIKGFLSNGNNFALTAMMLLFLFDKDRMGNITKLLHFALVLCLILMSHTSGALLGFLVGMTCRVIFRDGKNLTIGRCAVSAVGMMVAASIFYIIPQNTVKALDSTKAKIEVTYDNLNNVLSDKSINFYEISLKNKQNVTSGLWRIYHWKNVQQVFWKSSLDNILFGHGIGTIKIKFGIEAHNDYLRFLYQVGLVGLLCNLLVWLALFRRMDVRHRWVAIMIAFYCMTENNYDNFLVMSMFALYVLGTMRFNCDALPKEVSENNHAGLFRATYTPARAAEL